MIFSPAITARSITDFCVCFFKDNKHDKDAPPHYYIACPVRDTTARLFMIITSKVEKRKAYYNRTNPTNARSLVEVDEGSLSCLRKTSAIDCNLAELIYLNELDDRVNAQYGFVIVARAIPRQLQESLRAAIKRSSLVKEYIKDMI